MKIYVRILVLAVFLAIGATAMLGNVKDANASLPLEFSASGLDLGSSR